MTSNFTLIEMVIVVVIIGSVGVDSHAAVLPPCESKQDHDHQGPGAVV